MCVMFKLFYIFVHFKLYNTTAIHQYKSYDFAFIYLKSLINDDDD